MEHRKRIGVILIAGGLLLLVGALVWKAPAHRSIAASPNIGHAEDQDIPPKNRDNPKVAEVQKGKDPFKDLSYFFSRPYKVDSYIRAAVALQESGKEKARKTLLALARRDTVFSGNESYAGNKESGVFVLCRMLFIGRGASFRAPGIGRFECPGGTDEAGWSLEPIELVDGIPFLIIIRQRPSAGGDVESPFEYLEYCLHNCVWNPYRFHFADAQEKQQALEKLFASPK